MRRCSLLLLTLAVLLPATALGKGADGAAIEGPGLSQPIVLTGAGEPGSVGPMGQIAEAAGFFPAIFPQTPDPMLDSRPEGTLGPKYTITWSMPGPNNESDEIVQDVYPYASPSALSYVEPGQKFWTTERTRGGWFVAAPTLRDQLVEVGLPASPPTSGDPSGSDWEGLGPFALVLVTASLAGLAAFALRRRPRPA